MNITEMIFIDISPLIYLKSNVVLKVLTFSFYISFSFFLIIYWIDLNIFLYVFNSNVGKQDFSFFVNDINSMNQVNEAWQFHFNNFERRNARTHLLVHETYLELADIFFNVKISRTTLACQMMKNLLNRKKIISF